MCFSPDRMTMVHRARVNAAFMQQYHGKPVCLLATVIKADGGGTAFQVKSSDGHQITVRLKSPINEPLSGLIEVYGQAQGRSLVMADSFTIFPEAISATFDMNAYNEALQVLQQLSSTSDSSWLPAS